MADEENSRDNDEVHDRIVSRTLSIAPVDRDKLRQFYEEQKEDSFIHPEPVFPDDKTPAFEEASFNVFKLKKLDEPENSGPTHAGEGNTSELRETVFLGRERSKLRRKKSKKRSKSRDEEDLRSSTAKSEEAREEEAVELVPLQIAVKGDNSDNHSTGIKNGETEMSIMEEERSSRKSRKKKKKKYLERHASESRVAEMMQTTHNPEDGVTGAPEDPSDLSDRSQRKKRALSQEALLTQPSTEVEEQTEGTESKSKKKKKKRETSPRDPERVEPGEGETGEGELLWRKAKKKVKKKKKIREKEVIEAMTGQEIPEDEKLPPQIRKAAYVEPETATSANSRESTETRALPPLLTKRAFSLNKIHTADSKQMEKIPEILRDDSVLVGKSIPPIASMMGAGDKDKTKTEGKLKKEEEKKTPLLGDQMERLRDLEEGQPQAPDKEESKEIECTRFPCLARLRPCFAAIGRFFTRLWRFITKDRDWTSREKKCIVAIVTSVLAAIVFLGLFPSSFVYLDYYEYAMKYDKVTGAVDRSEIYEFGCYILGPSTAFLSFPRSAHVISNSHEVFTADEMSIKITYHIQYFLRKSEIGTLHKEFDSGYDSVIRSIVESEMKNSAAGISIDHFRFQRSNLEKSFLDKLKKRLEGNCCQSCCPSSCTNNTICSSCLGPTSCDQGYHISISYFQLTKVDIPKEVLDRFLQSVLLQEYALTEYLKQEKAVEDKITLRQTSLVYNEANEIVEVGNAESQKLQVIAEADRDANLTTAYVGALSSMYTTLNVVREDHKLSIMMIRVLEEAAVKGNLYWSYGYENETIYDRPLALPAG